MISDQPQQSRNHIQQFINVGAISGYQANDSAFEGAFMTLQMAIIREVRRKRRGSFPASISNSPKIY